MASIIKCDTIQSTTSNVFVLNSVGTEYARFDSTGVFQLANPTTFPAGTVALPSITATGDTNTGLYFPAADTIAFSEGGVESMRIDSSGNVGIGSTPTTIGSYKVLEVNGTSGAYIGLKQGGTEYGNIYNNSTDGTTISASGTRNIIFQTNGAERIRIPGDAGGIKFLATQSASADANTLDDYEEGTWTPSVGGTATYGTRIAHYTKIGDTVRAFFDISIGTIGTGSLTTMSGFPFTCTNNDSGCISYFAGLGATVYFIQIQMSGTNCIFVGLTAAGATINNGMNVFTTGARIIGTVVYKTTT